MNLETLVRLIRPDVIANYTAEDMFNKEEYEVDDKLLLRWEVVKEGVDAGSNTGYLSGVNSYHVIRNKDTNNHYKIQYTHDSWNDFFEPQNVKISKVQPEEVTVTVYDKVLVKNVDETELK